MSHIDGWQQIISLYTFYYTHSHTHIEIFQTYRTTCRFVRLFVVVCVCWGRSSMAHEIIMIVRLRFELVNRPMATMSA